MSFKKMSDKKDEKDNNCIIVYGFDNKTLGEIEKIKKSLKIEKIISVNDNNINLQLYDIINEDESLNCKTDENKIMIFNTGDYTANQFITEIKKKVDFSIIFAMLNNNNIKWKFINLKKEIIEEYKQFKKRR